MSFDKTIKNLLIVIEVAALVIVCGAGAVVKAKQLAGDKAKAVFSQSGEDKAKETDTDAEGSQKKTIEEEKDPEETKEDVQEAADAAEALTF